LTSDGGGLACGSEDLAEELHGHEAAGWIQVNSKKGRPGSNAGPAKKATGKANGDGSGCGGQTQYDSLHSASKPGACGRVRKIEGGPTREVQPQQQNQHQQEQQQQQQQQQQKQQQRQQGCADEHNLHLLKQPQQPQQQHQEHETEQAPQADLLHDDHAQEESDGDREVNWMPQFEAFVQVCMLLCLNLCSVGSSFLVFVPTICPALEMDTSIEQSQ
jgi:hypothetical protein